MKEVVCVKRKTETETKTERVKRRGEIVNLYLAIKDGKVINECSLLKLMTLCSSSHSRHPDALKHLKDTRQSISGGLPGKVPLHHPGLPKNTVACVPDTRERAMQNLSSSFLTQEVFFSLFQKSLRQS